MLSPYKDWFVEKQYEKIPFGPLTWCDFDKLAFSYSVNDPRFMEIASELGSLSQTPVEEMREAQKVADAREVSIEVHGQIAFDRFKQRYSEALEKSGQQDLPV